MACGSCASRTAPIKFEYTDKSGNKSIKTTEVEARAAVARTGGTYRKL
ncbi:hypothetical protein SEA_BRUHMOMENT_20 [Arthrobacter phage BruhMoment]|nr:hypothetical protein SEA_BRUHMOMENT_20 [Arthrobacter phage BruhMoment]